MEHFDEFLDLMNSINPDANIDGDLRKFLKDNFKDLKEFMEELSKESNAKQIHFKEVSVDQYFYADRLSSIKERQYVKLDNNTARNISEGTVVHLTGSTLVDVIEKT